MSYTNKPVKVSKNDGTWTADFGTPQHVDVVKLIEHNKMAEPPDFEQIAMDTVVDFLSDALDFKEPVSEYDRQLFRRTVAQALRQVWNARGAADVDVLEASKHSPDVESIRDLKRSVRKLDR